MIAKKIAKMIPSRSDLIYTKNAARPRFDFLYTKNFAPPRSDFLYTKNFGPFFFLLLFGNDEPGARISDPF